MASFWKPEACGQTVLPDRLILIGQKLAKMPKFKCDILSNFQTMWHNSLDFSVDKMMPTRLWITKNIILKIGFELWTWDNRWRIVILNHWHKCCLLIFANKKVNLIFWGGMIFDLFEMSYEFEFSKNFGWKNQVIHWWKPKPMLLDYLMKKHVKTKSLKKGGVQTLNPLSKKL